MTRERRRRWIDVLKKCVDEKWSLLARGEVPLSYECGACDFSIGFCGDCPLDGELGCCDGLYDKWDDARGKGGWRESSKQARQAAQRVVDFIRRKRRALMRKR